MWFVYTRVLTFEGETQIEETILKHGPFKSSLTENANMIRSDLFAEWYIFNMQRLYQTVETLQSDEWWWNHNLTTTAYIYCSNIKKSFHIKLETLIKNF